jgi:hypothetical protein
MNTDPTALTTPMPTGTTPGGLRPAPTPAPSAERRRLHPAVLRLIAIALVFVGWMAYLAYLVATRPLTSNGTPLVLSRPQILVSEFDVVARVDSTDVDATVTIEEVLKPTRDSQLQVGDMIHVTNLADCHHLVRSATSETSEADWTGPGLYLLPLFEADKDRREYRVVKTPRSPGFSLDLPRIYPATKAALAQYREIPRP